MLTWASGSTKKDSESSKSVWKTESRSVYQDTLCLSCFRGLWVCWYSVTTTCSLFGTCSAHMYCIHTPPVWFLQMKLRTVNPNTNEFSSSCFSLQIQFISPSIALLYSLTFSLSFPSPSYLIPLRSVRWHRPPVSIAPRCPSSSNNLLSPSHCPALHQRPSETLADSRVLFLRNEETVSAPAVTNGDADLIWSIPSHN